MHVKVYDKDKLIHTYQIQSSTENIWDYVDYAKEHARSDKLVPADRLKELKFRCLP